MNFYKFTGDSSIFGRKLHYILKQQTTNNKHVNNLHRYIVKYKNGFHGFFAYF